MWAAYQSAPMAMIPGTGTTAVLIIALCGLATGAASMWIYGALAPQRRISALKIRVATAQLKLSTYDGADPRKMLQLTAEAIGPALQQFALIAGPTIVALLPLLVVGNWVNRRYSGRMMYEIGPRWSRTWEVPFTIALSVAAGAVKLFKKKQPEPQSGAFHVTLGNHLMSGTVHHARPLWRALGNLETSVLRRQLDSVPIAKPIYVAGLARSGTSVLIEILASHSSVATHQYRDFPFLFIPYWWRQTLQRSAPAMQAATERAHGDRLMVSAQSPEAMEEMLWMTFFSNAHRNTGCDVLERSVSNPAFEKFYLEHIQKLLLIAGRSRYAAKGNYNLTRLAYLQKLFPDARFVLPVRHPREHIASLMKQHRIFTAAAERYPRSVAHLDRVGHFEFGAHRRCINPSLDSSTIDSIEKLWKQGEEVRGWARYWAMLHDWVGQQLQADPQLREATLVLKYETLCEQPTETLKQLLAHCDLADAGDQIVNRFAPSLSKPTYYQTTFSSDEERAIAEEAGATADEWGIRV